MKAFKIVIFLGALAIVIFLLSRGRHAQDVIIADFASCAAAGYPIMESYPRQCRTPEGKSFVEDVGGSTSSPQDNELAKADVIRIISPRPNDTVTSPLTITGEARGTWFFEASFPVRLEDENGVQLGIVPATAKGEWMTTEFVPFSATLTFSKPATENGRLILEKDNPSGLPEHADALIFPVHFDTNATP